MKRIGIFLFVVLVCSSCKDFLNLTPSNKKVVYTQEDVKETISSYFFTLGVGNTEVRFNGDVVSFPVTANTFIAGTMYGDDIDLTEYFRYTSSAGAGYESLYNECVDWKGVSVASSLWKKLYLSVGYMNEALKNLKNAEVTDADERERIGGEARVFRAYYLFKLLQFFAPYHDNALGIPIVLDPDVVAPQGRTKQSRVYEIIIDELTEVLNYKALPTEWDVMYNKDIIRSILAQVYLFKGLSAAAEPTDWENASKYASEVTSKYALERTLEDYKIQFIPGAKPRIIKNNPHALLILVIYDNYKSGRGYAPWGAQDERLFPSQDLVELYDQNDLRLQCYLGFQKMQGVDRWYIGKYNFYDNQAYYSYNSCFTMFRIAETWLIQAEAEARMENNDVAKDLLIRFKKTRIPGYTDFSGDVLQEILNERRKEFCYEGEARFMDMKRLGIEVDRMGLESEDSKITKYTLKKDDYRFAFPIPTGVEMEYNNKIEQNPGWINVK